MSRIFPQIFDRLFDTTLKKLKQVRDRAMACRGESPDPSGTVKDVKRQEF